MKAYALKTPGDQRLEQIEIDDVTPTSDQVLIDVTHSGVCHSDVHLREGGYDMGSQGVLSVKDRGVPFPLILGHEIAGTVAEVGPDVTTLKVGDPAVVYPWLGCGQCNLCAAGDENKCRVMSRPLGIAQPGGYAEQVLVSASKYCVPLRGLDSAWGATLSCSGLTAYAAAKRVLPLDAEEHVTIIGAGGVGLTAVAVLTALGHKNITVLDRTAANFEAATELGARRTFLTSDTSSTQEVLAQTGGPSVAILDFVNSGITAALAFTLLDKAGTMVQVGLFGGEFLVSTATLIFQQKQIVGSYTGGLSDLEACVEMARKGQLPRPPISVTPMSLPSLESALDALAQGLSHGRVVLEQPSGRSQQVS